MQPTEGFLVTCFEVARVNSIYDIRWLSNWSENISVF